MDWRESGEVTNKGNLLTKILRPISRQPVGLWPIVWVTYGGANTSEVTNIDTSTRSIDFFIVG